MFPRFLLVTLALVFGVYADASETEGQRLAYVLGCVNCHHQTPRDIINAPPLVIVQSYSYEQFSRLLKSGVTSTERNLVDLGSIMGIVAIEQFSHLKDEEIAMLFEYLKNSWTQDLALEEESKIPSLYKFDDDDIE